MNKLKEIQEKYNSENLKILAFPTNQFANEPSNFTELSEIY
jgi:glutathione peroxidase-family protein